MKIGAISPTVNFNGTITVKREDLKPEDREEFLRTKLGKELSSLSYFAFADKTDTGVAYSFHNDGYHEEQQAMKILREAGVKYTYSEDSIFTMGLEELFPKSSE